MIALARELGLVDPLNVGSNIQLARMNLHGGCIRVAAQREDLGLQLIEAVPVSALLPRPHCIAASTLRSRQVRRFTKTGAVHGAPENVCAKPPQS